MYHSLAQHSLTIAGVALFGFVSNRLLIADDETASADLPTQACIRVLPDNQLPDDQRLRPLKSARIGHFPFHPPQTVDEWEHRAESVRRRILVATGLWPMQERPSPHAVVHGKVDREGYTVERVYLESYPGHFVTGNLYRPKGKSGPLPTVISPHGHWPGGRFHDWGLEEIRTQIAQGAERYEVGGRYPLQARCVQLARMGCNVFIYDMVGYCDSQQLTEEVIHGTKGPRPEFYGPNDWGFFSTQAELRMLSPLGLQTYNSLCVLDWIISLPEVDRDRIAVTGGSGGATQTLMLCATDDRIATAFPAVMVSTAMQGGCTCENACCLRVGAGNVDFAALFAPKPLGMASADDWTKDFQEDGFPELCQLYELLDARENVSLASLTQFKHNYNFVSRSAMYEWFNQHLDLGLETPIVEQDFVPLSEEELTVWGPEHPAPSQNENYERELLKTMNRLSKASIEAIDPQDLESLHRYQEIVRGALEVLLSCKMPDATEVDFTQVKRKDYEDYLEVCGLVHNRDRKTELPAVLLLPKQWNGEFILWAHGVGKQGLFAADGMPLPEIQKLLDHHFAVATADLFHQGEFLEDQSQLNQSRTVDSDRDLAPYTFGYNPTMFAHRTCDLLTLIAMLKNWDDSPRTLHLFGTEGAGVWALAARALSKEEVASAFVATEGFRFANLSSWRDTNFLPGAVKYGDVPGLIALSAPLPLCVSGETYDESFSLANSAYEASNAQDAFELLDTDETVSATHLIGRFLEAYRRGNN